MKNYRFMNALLYGLMSLALILLSCGGERGNDGNSMPFSSTTRGVSVSRKIPVLRGINITPKNPLGISSGTQIQFTATGFYSDKSEKDLTMLVVWTSSDTSIVTISNESGLIGLATALSKGYCSISATSVSVSDSTIIGVN